MKIVKFKSNEKMISNNKIPLLVEKTFLEAIERTNLPRDKVILVDICDGLPDVLGGPASPIRIDLQQHWKTRAPKMQYVSLVLAKMCKYLANLFVVGFRSHFVETTFCKLVRSSIQGNTCSNFGPRLVVPQVELFTMHMEPYKQIHGKCTLFTHFWVLVAHGLGLENIPFVAVCICGAIFGNCDVSEQNFVGVGFVGWFVFLQGEVRQLTPQHGFMPDEGLQGGQEIVTVPQASTNVDQGGMMSVLVPKRVFDFLGHLEILELFHLWIELLLVGFRVGGFLSGCAVAPQGLDSLVVGHFC